MSARLLYRPRPLWRQIDVGVIDLRDNPQGEPVRKSQLRASKVFGSPAFRRLWFSQVTSALGDWIGLVAITAIANRVGGGLGMGAVSLVLAARLVPGFFFSPFAGLLLDRWNRKHIMVVCDIGRAAVLFVLPFMDNLTGLIAASLVLELLTLLWSPAKEASVPHLVSAEFLPNANSLSLVAAYGTLPFASALFAVLAKVPDWLGQSEHFQVLHLTKESVALYFDGLTYLVSALTIASLTIVHQRRSKERGSGETSKAQGMKEAIEGWKLIRTNKRVRTVVIGMATGLIGGGVIVPLGPGFATQVLHSGSGGYGLLLTAMGTGTALGILTLTVLQKRLPIDQTYVFAILGAGAALAVASAMSSLALAAVGIGVLGLCAGAVYTLGFTILQVSVTDDVRGRVFTMFYTVTRLCLLLALTLAPLLSLALDRLSNRWVGGSINVAGLGLSLPGVRLTLWIGALIVIGAGVLAVRSLGRPAKQQS